MAFNTQLPDIPTPVATGVTGPDTSTANLIQQVGEVAGNTVRDVQKNRLEADLQQSADVVTAISGAVEQKGRGVFDTSGEVNTEGLTPDLQQQIARVQAAAGDKFKRIASAVKQGAMAENAAALETESAVRKLINQTPGFAPEIKQLARELTGFDPTGYALRQVLSVNKPSGSTRLTAQQKRLEEAEVIQDGLSRVGQNIPLDTILGNLAIRDQSQLQQQILDSQLDINTITTTQWAQQSFVERGPDLGQTILKVVQMGQEGGITDPTQYTNAVVAQREEDKQQFRAQVADRGGMDTGKMTAILSQIDAQYEPLIESIKNNGLGNILGTKLDTIAKVNQLWGKQATPRITRIVDAYGDRVGAQMLDMMSNIADPAQFELIYQFDPGLKALIESGKMTQKDASNGITGVVSKIMNGENLTENDLQFRHMAEVWVTQLDKADLREKFVRGMGESGSPIRGLSLLTSKIPRSKATDDEIKYVKEQFKVYVGAPATDTQPGSLINKIANELADLGKRAENLQIQPVMRRTQVGRVPRETAGGYKITFDKRGTTRGGVLTGTTESQTDAMKQLKPFLDAVMFRGYAPDLKINQDGFSTEILSRIQNRIEQIKANQTEEE